MGVTNAGRHLHHLREEEDSVVSAHREIMSLETFPLLGGPTSMNNKNKECDDT